MADVSQIKLPNGSVYDLIDEKSGYITAEYIENKTDYEIPVSRVGEIVVGETAIGTDSTNFPTSKAVVDYVDERVVQEMDAIDVGVISVNGKTGSVTLSASDIGAATTSQIPTSTSQLTNDSGFITSYTDTKVEQAELSDSSNLNKSVLLSNDNNSGNTVTGKAYKHDELYYNPRYKQLTVKNIQLGGWAQPGTITIGGVKLTSVAEGSSTITLPDKTGTIALTSDIPTVPTNISSFTNDSGYLTSSDIASVMTYKGTKANYAALPSTGNITGDVWHLTDTGAEWAWDGSAWQELGTAIDLSSYATKATTLAGYGITDAKIENGTITLGSNTITPLTSYTETDPTVPSWAKASTKPSYGLTEISGTDDLRAIEALTGTSGLLKKTAANTWTLDTNTYLTSYTETDPTVPSWAKQSSKPTYTATEVGALPDTTTIPSKTSDLTNDSGFITSYTDEKVKQNEVDVNDKYSYPLLFSDNYSYGNKITGTYKTSSLTFNPKSSLLTTSNIQIGGLLAPGSIKLGYLEISAVADTSANTINFPNASGTIALTSDLPDTSSFLTSETDPVFSASSAAGISATDISNWNGKAAGDHQHGNISNEGHITTYGSITSGSRLIFAKSNTWAVTMAPASMAFGSDSTKYLANDGTWQSIPDTSSFLTSETDPVFSASAAAGITATDISNWNAKSSTDEKLKTITGSSNNTSYYPIFGTNNTSSASTKFIDTTSFMYYKDGTYTYLVLGSSATGAGSIILRNINNVDTTIKCSATTTGKTITFPNASGTVALTSDIPSKTSDLTNDSGFITSYTDEKLGLSLASSPVYYYPILTIDTTTAGKKSYDNDGFIYYNYSGTTSAVGNAKLTLGNNKTATTAKNKQGTLELYGSTAYAIRITAGAPTVTRNIEFPNKDGTIALTSDITDEKLSVTNNSTVGSYYPILDTGASGAASTKTSDGFLKFSRSSNTQGVLSIGENGSAIGQLRLFTTSSGEYVTITPGTLTSARTITLPDKTGTIALTSDIPDTSSFLTSETDPVFTASAAAGITSTDISNWNSKADIYDITTGVGSSGSGSNLDIVLSNYYGNYEYRNFMVFVNKSQSIGSTTIVRTTTNAIDNQLEIQRSNIILNGRSSPYTISPGLYYCTLSAWSSSATLTLTSAPTVADIPSVYSSTNTGGYLTMATLPIYDGTVV